MTTPDDVLLSETKGAVRLLTLNRPAKLNAINAELVHALSGALHAVQADDDISVVILRGSGRAFSAGADTSTPRPLTEENRKRGKTSGTQMACSQNIGNRVAHGTKNYGAGADQAGRNRALT